MFEPEDFQPKDSGEGPSLRESFGGYNFTGETDRVNGEYHYKNGYTQKIYSDAHYVPMDENTAPPRYYTPPEKPVREPKPPRKRKARFPWGRVLAACLLCALLGGAVGAGAMGARFSGRLGEMETELTELRQQAEKAPLPASQAAASGPVSASLSAGQIYSQACRQTVGVRTEVTYTNIFGLTSSSPVSGSGFILSENGYILTNYHVIESAYQNRQNVTVMLHDGSQYSAEIVGVEDDGSDVAVLKIDAAGLSPVTLGDSDSLSVGDDAYVVGNPLGELEFSMTTGHVSALDRLITTDANSEAINMFQIDAAVNHGNSGGPVYNSLGQVIGVVTAKYSDTGVEGLGFAIPINEAYAIASDLITQGYVSGKASLGLRIDERYNSMYSQYYGMPIGAYVYSVERGSAAENAGIQAGDIITRLGDEDVSSYNELRAALRQFSAGDSASVGLYRAGESLELSVVFDEEGPDESSANGRS